MSTAHNSNRGFKGARYDHSLCVSSVAHPQQPKPPLTSRLSPLDVITSQQGVVHNILSHIQEDPHQEFPSTRKVLKNIFVITEGRAYRFSQSLHFAQLRQSFSRLTHLLDFDSMTGGGVFLKNSF